ncbi:hypothetical protein [Defluviitalea phaphyphila]|uniref:hypothetical protein n=1 Tax=Defluviitalea phaphyphila TaxID=1473580 RepID=UPI0013657E7D|nr:hypothetical protein [Defluviitalea phaphyphila]
MDIAELIYLILGGVYVIKRAIYISSFICAIVIELLVFFYISNSQHKTMFGTTNQFILNVAESSTSKTKIISELNKIVERNNAILVKESVFKQNNNSFLAIITENNKTRKELFYVNITKRIFKTND